MKLQNELIKNESLSNADDVGKVFTYEGHIYRGIYINNCENIREMFDSGLIEELIKKRLIPNTWITDLYTDEYPLIIESERISPVTYYLEWPAEQICDAGQLVLEISKIAWKYGYSLQDCHPYNVLYSKGKMLWCDLGSFKKNRSFPLQEYITFYGTTIRLINKDSFYARCMMRMKHYPDIFNQLRVLCGGLVIPLFLWKVLLCVNIKIAYKLPVYEKILKKLFICRARVPKTFWSEYQDFDLDVVFEDNLDGRFTRFSRIEKIIDELKPKTVFEFAANKGILACYLAQKEYISEYVASDYDEYAINELYKYVKKSKYLSSKKIIPLVVDFSEEHHHINLITLDGRAKSELVIACAVTHHLLLTQYISIDKMFEKLKNYTTRYLLVEFMPLGLWDGHNAPDIPEYYTLDWFKLHMSKYFNIKLVEQLEKNRILLLGECNN